MTLVELLFCAVIFVLIMGACMALLFRGWDSWQTSSAQVQLAQEESQSVGWLTNDIRQSGASQITNVPADNNGYAQITFSVVQNVLSGGNITWNAGAINYSLGGTLGHELIRTQNGQSRVIANNITSLQFSRQTLTPNMVNIQLAAFAPTYRGNQQLTSTLTFKVFLRNT